MEQRAWYRELNKYQWWVLIVAALGWLFDTMDQQIYVLSRSRALDELLAVEVSRSRLESIALDEAAALLEISLEETDRFESVIVQHDGDGTPNALVFVAREADADDLSVTVAAPPGERDEDGDTLLVYRTPRHRDSIGQLATAIFIAGWATGGLFFGIIGDKWGRTRTMMITILMYSLFTGLSALSVSWIDYTAYRFLTGVGVGGEFAAGIALVAEVMPDRARPYALGLLQALSGIGNIAGSLVGNVVLSQLEASWRYMYLVGIFPALLVVIIRSRLREPERWTAVKESAAQLLSERLGAMGDLFRRQPWRRHTSVGVVLVLAGVIGLWGVGFWTPELLRGHVLGEMPVGDRENIVTLGYAVQQLGAMFGILAISLLTQGVPRTRAWPAAGAMVVSGLAAVGCWLWARSAASVWLECLTSGFLAMALFFAAFALSALTGGIGRKGAFAVAFLLAMAGTTMAFGYMERRDQVFWMMPTLGFCNLMVFGMYAIYLPELFPTRLRSTGTGFCYNVARYLATLQAPLMIWFVARFQSVSLLTGVPFRDAAVAVAGIAYALGFVALVFAPETRGRPLPE